MSKSFEDYLNTPDNSMMYDTQDIEENKPWAILSYIAVLWILPLFVNGGCSKFGRFHANQGFILFLLEIACSIACALLGWIPLVGWIIKTVLGLAVTILMVIGIVNAATGKAKELPFISGLMHVFE